MREHLGDGDHLKPLQRVVEGIQLSPNPSPDYRVIAESVGIIIKKRAEIEEHQRQLAHTAKLLEAAHISPVSGLPNRIRYEQDIEPIVRRAHLDEQPLAMAFLDAREFKQVNDKLGHETGDSFLRHMGIGIQAGVRPLDKVYHIGGDEFIVLMPGYEAETDDPKNTVIRTTAQHIKDSIRGEIAALGFPDKFNQEASVGICILQPGETPADLLRRADQAMYADKRGEQKRAAPGPWIRAD